MRVTPFFCLDISINSTQVQKLPPTFSTYTSIRPSVRRGGLSVRGKAKSSVKGLSMGDLLDDLDSIGP